MEHPISQRIKIIMNREANGNEIQFAKRMAGIPYQSISRLFKLDKRGNKYPIPSTSLILEIINTFTWYSPRWLLTGYGEMLIDEDVLTEEETTFSRELTDVEMIEYWRHQYVEVQKKYIKLQEEHALLLKNKLKEFIEYDKSAI